MEKFNKTVAGGVFLAMAFTGTAFAGDADLEQLQQQIQALIQQNKALTERVARMEQERLVASAGQAAGASSVSAEALKSEVQQAVSEELQKQREENPSKINEYVTFNGLIEGEAAFGEDYANESSSEYTIATVELGIDAQVNEWVAGHLLAKYEGGDDDNLFIDEATIEIGDYEKYPLMLTGGKFYMPFGNFETNMIQDPMTLEIGEINAAGLALGFEHSGFSGSIYSYKGMAEIDSSDTIKGFGAMLGYSYEADDAALDVGVSWVNNIADSGAISDYFDENFDGEIIDRVPGFGAHIMASYDAFSLVAEYVQATDNFDAAEIAFNGEGAEPKAWNIELAYTMELLERETVFAVGYQGTREAIDLELPYARYIGAISVGLFEGTTLTLEYFHDEDYDVEDYGSEDGGTGEDACGFTAQLAYEF